MKNSILPPAANQPSNTVTQKLKKPGTAVIPAGFHPLSGKIVDVLVALQEEFVYSPNWWRRGAETQELTVSYYQALRQVLRESTRSQRLLARCCHCNIFF